MSISKNFVVRNGFEVSTDLILANADTRKVGIGTTIPERELQVAGGIGATDFYLTGIGTFVDELNVGLGGTILTVLGLENSVGIGTALPAYLLDIRSPVLEGQTALYVQGDVEITGDILIDNISVDDAEIENLNVTDTLFVVGLSTFNSNVFIDASLNVSGISTLGKLLVNSGIITATSGIVTYYGDGQYLDLTNNASTGIGIGTTGGLVGYGITFIDFYGSGVSAAFYDSSVGIATIFFEGGGSGTIGIGTEFPVLAANGDLFFNAVYGRLFVYYDENIIGVGTDEYWIDAAPFNVDLSQLDSLSLINLTVSNNTNLNNLNVTGISTLTSLNVGNVVSSGIITASAFFGDGSGLTGAGSTVFNDTTTDQEFFPLFTDITTGTITASGISTSKLSYNPFTGTLTAIDLNSTSDINLKENIKTVENALETVNSLRGVSFDWKENGKSSYGVIAQELEEVLPELVKNGDVKSVNYNGLIGILIEAIKELKAEIEKLKI